MPDFTLELDDDVRVPTADDVYGMGTGIPLPPRRDDVSALKNALVAGEDGTFRFRGFTLGATGLMQMGEATEKDWLDLGALLGALGQRMSLLIGDYLVAMDFGYGQSVEQLADLLGYEIVTLHQWKWVCKSVESSIRIEHLTFGHYQLVAKLHPDDQRAWLAYAAEHGLSIKKLRAEMKKLLQQGDNPTYPNEKADSPTHDSAALDAVFAGVTTLDNGAYHGVGSKMQQLRLWNDDEKRDWGRLTTRVANVLTGQMSLSEAECRDDLLQLREQIDAALREMGGGV